MLVMGCPAYRPGPYQPRSPPSPGATVCSAQVEVQQLLDAADQMAELGPSGPDLSGSLACADAVLATNPKSEDAAWRAARSLFFQSLQAPNERRPELSARCMDVAQIAMAGGTRAQSYYYAALCMGARARARHLEGLDLLPEMVEAGQAARRLDPRIVHAGPDRLLGGIYLRAPAWPTSVGDLDEALAHLRAAVETAPDWPENYLLLAEALLEDEQMSEARQVFATAKRLMQRDEAQGWVDFWSSDVNKLKDKLGCPSP